MPIGRLDERGPRRKVTVERSDPDVRSTSDILERHLGRLREGLDRGRQ
jgi:hypothetical protein